MERTVEAVVSRQDTLRRDAIRGLSPDVPQPHRPSPRTARRVSAPQWRAGAFNVRPVGRRNTWFLIGRPPLRLEQPSGLHLTGVWSLSAAITRSMANSGSSSGLS